MAKLVVSQNERILLHLAELEKYRDDAEVPMASSQEGIAQRLDTQVFNASRALASLEQEGLIFDRLAHVRGAPKRRRAYFLTEKGRSAAQAIQADIGKRRVVIEHAGKVQELTVEEAVRKLGLLTGKTPAFSDVVELGRQFDTVLSNALARPGPAPRSLPEFVIRTHGRPKVENFYGRDSEISALTGALSGTDKAVVLLWGMPGIGKSTLASKVFGDFLGKMSLFWYSLRDWDTESSFLMALTEFMSAAGRNSAMNAMKRGIGHAELFAALTADLSEGELAIFLDDVQKPAKDISYLLSMLLEAVKSSPSSKLILISRSLPQFFSKSSSGNLAIELSGLDRDSAWKLAQSLNAEDVIKVVEESHGHPLLLNMMARSGSVQAKDDVISFIEREVYSTISPQERSVLELLSIFRHPVPMEAIDSVDYSTIARLKQRALVMEQEEGIWTHDLLRDFLISHMASGSNEKLHSKAAGYCGRRTGVEWQLESLYHLVEAGDSNAACRVVAVNAMDLSKEFPEETLALLSRLSFAGIEDRVKAETLFVRGQLYEATGRHDSALADFESSLSMVGDSDTDKRALVLETVAKLQSQIRRWSESLSAHEKALKLYEKSGDNEAQAREWLNIGGVFRKRGDLSRARDAYMKALSLATKEEDRPSQAACLNNLALLDWDEGRLRDSELRLKESVKLAHAVRDHSGEARGLENLAELLRAQGKLTETSDLLLESSEAYRRAGEIVEFKRLQAACAESLGAQGRYDMAIELCEKALSRPELRRRRSLFQKSARYDLGDVALSSTLVDLHRASGDLKRAQKELARYTRISDSLGDSVLRARGRLMSAVIQEDQGDLEAAMKSLADAETMLRSSGSSEGLVAVHMRSGVIAEKVGDDATALHHYREAARHAELSSNKTALALAQENIKSLSQL